jgi:hypothetical protein
MGFSLSVGSATASFGPGRRSQDVEILDVALLRLRFQHPCGLVLNQNLPLLIISDHHPYRWYLDFVI